MPENHELHYGSISGSVLGYKTNNYTRPIHPAYVFLLIHILDKQEKSEYYYLSSEKELLLFKKHEINGLETLIKKYPELYHKIINSSKSFNPQLITSENTLSRFEFKNIPLGSWCYVVGAIVEDKVYLHTDKMGNDGFGTHYVIHGDKVFHEKNHTINNVIVPVEDKWISYPTIYHPKFKGTEVGMDDPNHVKKLLGGDK